MKYFLYTLLLIIISYDSFSQGTFSFVDNYDYSSNEIFNGIDTVSEDLGIYGIVYKDFILSSNLGNISFELESGLVYNFSLDVSFIDDQNQMIWRGQSSSFGCVDCEIHIVEYEDVLEATIFLEDIVFALSPVGDENFLYYQLSSHNSDCDIDHFPSIAVNEENENGRTTSSISACNGLETYSMIIAYTPQFAEEFTESTRQRDINEFLDDVIESVNESYENSDLNLRTKLAFSYQTPDSEFGNKDDDFDAFTNIVHCTGLFCNGEKWREYDEIYDYRIQHNADVAVLLVAADIGGRADDPGWRAIYGRRGAGRISGGNRYGIAHEIGHLLKLEHNREEFGFFAKLFLDGKKAYGYRNDDFRTVMSYGFGRTREPIYSDPNYSFSNGSSAGNDKAKARRHIPSQKHRVLIKSDYQNYSLQDNTISSDQTLNQFALEKIITQNFVAETSSRVVLQAQNSVILKSGTHLKAGSTVELSIFNCSNSASSSSARVASETEVKLINGEVSYTPDTSFFITFPNPTSNVLHIEFNSETPVHYLQITNHQGQIIFERQFKQTLSYKAEVDVTGFSPGLYSVRLCNLNGDCTFSKVLVK